MKTDAHQALSSQDEIFSNVFWRFLQLRGYIDQKSHQLTPWGLCLEQALSVLDPNDSLEESTFLAIEMIRLGLINSKQWFSHVSGGPMRGTGKRSLSPSPPPKHRRGSPSSLAYNTRR